MESQVETNLNTGDGIWTFCTEGSLEKTGSRGLQLRQKERDKSGGLSHKRIERDEDDVIGDWYICGIRLNF